MKRKVSPSLPLPHRMVGSNQWALYFVNTVYFVNWFKKPIKKRNLFLHLGFGLDRVNCFAQRDFSKYCASKGLEVCVHWACCFASGDSDITMYRSPRQSSQLTEM